MSVKKFLLLFGRIKNFSPPIGGLKICLGMIRQLAEAFFFFAIFLLGKEKWRIEFF